MRILVQFADNASNETLGSFMIFAFRQTQCSNISPRKGALPAYYLSLPNDVAYAEQVQERLKTQFGASIVHTQVVV